MVSRPILPGPGAISWPAAVSEVAVAPGTVVRAGPTVLDGGAIVVDAGVRVVVVAGTVVDDVGTLVVVVVVNVEVVVDDEAGEVTGVPPPRATSTSVRRGPATYG